MCGIVGIITSGIDAAPVVLAGLGRLEYRGYDSAGIATLHDGKLHICRAVGKLAELSTKLAAQPLPGKIAIGHTRWATHGKPTEVNAHPHTSGNVAVVHNGIIENHKSLRAMLMQRGHVFFSDTDTEVIAHLITDVLPQHKNPQDAVAAALRQLEGAFAIAVLISDYQDTIICARRGSPLVLGFNRTSGEVSLGSDALALATIADQLCYLEDGDLAVLRNGNAIIYDSLYSIVNRARTNVDAMGGMAASKGAFRHFMLKEIFEQPEVVGETLDAFNDNLDDHWRDMSRLTITGCGTAWHAGLVARSWFEQLAGLPCDVDIASEFRYRNPCLTKDGGLLAISQSGETADTLAALEPAMRNNQRISAVVNVSTSSLARAVSDVFLTRAGPEIGVASTKAFTTQLAVLCLLACAVGVKRDFLSKDRAAEIISALRSMPSRMAEVLRNISTIREVARDISQARDVLFLGRGQLWPIALEGALKLKEISYIHAEGYPAGEMKHGPIALIDDKVPVVVLAPGHDELFAKTSSNIAEVAARGGRVIAVTDAQGAEKLIGNADHIIVMPTIDPMFAPLIYSLPMQIIAYEAAVMRGTDVDQPRNLAKSVTVE